MQLLKFQMYAYICTQYYHAVTDTFGGSVASNVTEIDTTSSSNHMAQQNHHLYMARGHECVGWFFFLV